MTQTVLVDRWFAKLPWPRGLSVALVGLTFIALPIVSAWSAQIDPWTLLTHFRAQFVYAAMIVYILLIIPPISETRAEVAAGLRPLIHLDDAAYRRLVDNAGNLRVVGEVSAFCLGVIDGVLEDALDYAKQRKAFGRTIGEFQAIQHKLADIGARHGISAERVRQLEREALAKLRRFADPDLAA